MAKTVRLVKPTTSGQRKMSYSSFDEITKNTPEKSLIIPLKKHSGRDKSGRLSVRHRGGGSKRMYRLIDFSGLKRFDQTATVLAIEYDPNRSSRIALVQYEDGIKAYLIAPQNLIVGATIKTAASGSVTVGNRLPLSAIPTG